MKDSTCEIIEGILTIIFVVVIVAAFLNSRPAYALDLSLDGGMGLRQSDSIRVGTTFPVKKWLRVDTGVLATNGGIIADVTPMFQYGHPLFVEGGIGLSVASATELGGASQSSLVNFRDVLGVGYRVDRNWLVGVHYVHYSNGGERANPLFGTKDNSGYDWVVLRVGRQL